MADKKSKKPSKTVPSSAPFSPIGSYQPTAHANKFKMIASPGAVFLQLFCEHEDKTYNQMAMELDPQEADNMGGYLKSLAMDARNQDSPEPSPSTRGVAPRSPSRRRCSAKRRSPPTTTSTNGGI